MRGLGAGPDPVEDLERHLRHQPRFRLLQINPANRLYALDAVRDTVDVQIQFARRRLQIPVALEKHRQRAHRGLNWRPCR